MERRLGLGSTSSPSSWSSEYSSRSSWEAAPRSRSTVSTSAAGRGKASFTTGFHCSSPSSFTRWSCFMSMRPPRTLTDELLATESRYRSSLSSTSGGRSLRLASASPKLSPKARHSHRGVTPELVGSAPVLERPREVLQRLLRLRLLLAGEVDALAGEVRPCLCSDLERLVRRGAGRELEHARAVGVDPHLGDEPAPELLWREAQLEHEDRPEDRQVVELDPRRMLGEVRALLLREELAHRALAGDRFLDLARVERSLQGPRAHETAGQRVDLHAKPGRGAQLRGELRRHDRPQLHDRVVALALDAPPADDDAQLVESQVGGFEEEDLSDLRVERVHAERADGRALVVLGHGQLQLDAVRVFDQVEHLRDLLLRKGYRGRLGGRHRGPP